MPGTSYQPSDFASNNGRFFVCRAAHVSSAATEPGVGVDWATYWRELGFGFSVLVANAAAREALPLEVLTPSLFVLQLDTGVFYRWTGSAWAAITISGMGGGGGGMANHQHVWNETPSGTINGVNDTFTLVAAPDPGDSLLLFRNGLLLQNGVEFTLAGSTITFAGAYIPDVPDTLVSSYRIAGTSAHSHVSDETPVGTVDGTNAVFTLSGSPSPAASLLLFKNGLLMRDGSGNDYTLSGNTITYTTASKPQPGDIHLASYTT